MTHLIATIARGKESNWNICKQESLWGIVGRGNNWRRNAGLVKAGDRVYIWISGRGFIAEIEALDFVTQTADSELKVPWADPDWFGATFPMRVIAELERPVGDSFPNETGRNAVRFGFNNTVLQHVFEAIPQDIAERIAEAFPPVIDSPGLGVPFQLAPRPLPVTPPQPAVIDPDLTDRGLAAHHLTLEALAAWVERNGWDPLLPTPHGPRYDLAWVSGETLNVAEVKSITSENQEMQLRVGLGQVLRYRQKLSELHSNVSAWLVAEDVVADPSWIICCASVQVILTWPSDLARLNNL